MTRFSQSEARDGAEFQDGGPHLHISPQPGGMDLDLLVMDIVSTLTLTSTSIFVTSSNLGEYPRF